ncbi:MAG: hypothetical protein LBC92_01100, partial [Rickettsiales bacterium]|nr:hypothetical protein [Rickettsiales bacterium]
MSEPKTKKETRIIGGDVEQVKDAVLKSALETAQKKFNPIDNHDCFRILSEKGKKVGNSNKKSAEVSSVETIDFKDNNAKYTGTITRITTIEDEKPYIDEEVIKAVLNNNVTPQSESLISASKELVVKKRQYINIWRDNNGNMIAGLGGLPASSNKEGINETTKAYKEDRENVAALFKRCCSLTEKNLEFALKKVATDRAQKDEGWDSMSEADRENKISEYIAEEREKPEVKSFSESIAHEYKTAKLIHDFALKPGLNAVGADLFNQFVGSPTVTFKKEKESLGEVEIRDGSEEYKGIARRFMNKLVRDGLIDNNLHKYPMEVIPVGKYTIGDVTVEVTGKGKDRKVTVKKKIYREKNLDEVNHKATFLNRVPSVKVPEDTRTHNDFIASKEIFQKNGNSLVAQTFKELMDNPTLVEREYKIEEKFIYDVTKREQELTTPDLTDPSSLIGKLNGDKMRVADLYVRIKGEEVILKEQYKEALKKAKQKKDEKDAEIKSLI